MPRKHRPSTEVYSFVPEDVPLPEFSISSVRNCRVGRREMDIPELEMALDLGIEQGVGPKILHMISNELHRKKMAAVRARIAKLLNQPRRVKAERKSKDRFVLRIRV